MEQLSTLGRGMADIKISIKDVQDLFHVSDFLPLQV